MPTAERTTWGREDDADVAITRLLDAAGEVFAEEGVTKARMASVATRANCSRGTLYRYFPDADALRIAFVDRAATQLGARIAHELTNVRQPDRRLVKAIELALAEVRADPVLAAWFAPDEVGEAGLVAGRAESIRALVDAFLELLASDDAQADRTPPRTTWTRPGGRSLAADWIVRIVLSLLAQPADTAHERAMLERFLVPSLFDV